MVLLSSGRHCIWFCKVQVYWNYFMESTVESAALLNFLPTVLTRIRERCAM